jgi:two-component system cell cycle sensor histidine kinase/response regulator CckA
MRTLVIEDDQAQRETLYGQLVALGQDVTAVADAESALVAHLRVPFDLLLVDWVLPGMDGLRLVQRLRSQPGGDSPFVIVVTARDRPEDLTRVLDAGADDYLAKPIDPSLLMTRVRIAERRVARHRLHDEDREALARTQAEFRRVIERCPLGVIARRGSTIAYANGAAARILGTTRQELIGVPFNDHIAPEFRDVVERRAQRFDRTSAPPPPIDLAMLRNDGGRLVARMIPVTQATFEGTTVHFVMVEDITARMAAERRLRMTQFAVDRAGDAILWVEAGGTVTYVNAATGKLLDQEADALVGGSFYDVDVGCNPSNWNEWSERLVRDGGQTFETWFKRKGGQHIAVEVTAYAIQFDGELLVVVSARDLTERERLRANLQRAERLASIGSLAAGVAHEINNPLAYVVANLELIAESMRRGTMPKGERESIMELVHAGLDGSDRVRRIVGDLRAFARSRDDHVEPVDVHTILEAAIGLADNQIRHRARLVRAYGNPGPVMAHEGRLTQVFVNLLVNAAQAIPEGQGDDPLITVVTDKIDDGSIVVAISDSGIGIEPRVVDRIFEPFFTTKPQGEGTGLGLSIVHGIVTSLGGRIEVTSAVGTGSTFRVVLPAAAADALDRDEDDDEDDPSDDDEDLADVRARLRVLVVDDEPMIGESVRKALASDQVTAIRSGREALTLCEREDYDLVLCDLMMPDVSGMDVYAAVRLRRPALADRFVFMTGGAFTPKAKAFLAARAVEPLSKPFSIGELRQIADSRRR